MTTHLALQLLLIWAVCMAFIVVIIKAIAAFDDHLHDWSDDDV